MTTTGPERDLIFGAMAGAIGAACMTPLRLGARRLGLVDKLTPQVIEESLAARLGWGDRASTETHHLVDQVMHLGFGAVMGIGYTLTTRRRRTHSPTRGLVFGAIAWGLGAGVVVPLLRAARPPWRARFTENLVNQAAHLLYGLTTALVAEELSTQRDHRPSTDVHRRRRRVG
jgi:uncharacterized membrane protein YagU involved in acid resistance